MFPLILFKLLVINKKIIEYINKYILYAVKNVKIAKYTAYNLENLLKYHI